MTEECLTGHSGAVPSNSKQPPPSFPQSWPGRGLEPEGPAGLGFPPVGGAAARRPTPPPGSPPRQMLQLFRILSRGVTPRPAQTRASLYFPAGVLPTSLREARLFSGLRAGREAGPGAGGSEGGERESRGKRN